MSSADEELQKFIDLMPSLSSLETMCYRCCRPAKIIYKYDGYRYWVVVSCHMGPVKASGVTYARVRTGYPLSGSDIHDIKVSVREVLDDHVERTEPLIRL